MKRACIVRRGRKHSPKGLRTGIYEDVWRRLIVFVLKYEAAHFYELGIVDTRGSLRSRNGLGRKRLAGAEDPDFCITKLETEISQSRCAGRLYLVARRKAKWILARYGDASRGVLHK